MDKAVSMKDLPSILKAKSMSSVIPCIVNAEDTDLQTAADTRSISVFPFCSAWEEKLQTG